MSAKCLISQGRVGIEGNGALGLYSRLIVLLDRRIDFGHYAVRDGQRVIESNGLLLHVLSPARCRSGPD